MAGDEPLADTRLRFFLSKPIEVPGTKEDPKTKLTEVVFRDPSGADLLAVGNPVIFDPVSNPPRVTHDPEKMAMMIWRLSGVTPGQQGQMAPQDWVGCAWLLTPFFVPPLDQI